MLYSEIKKIKKTIIYFFSNINFCFNQDIFLLIKQNILNVYA
jgi:hypothetical protein